jgi:hypothetical protein
LVEKDAVPKHNRQGDNNLKAVESPQKGKKRPYRSPELVAYGRLRELTLRLSNQGAKDGGIKKWHSS